jgi:hypothetical protein
MAKLECEVFDADQPGREKRAVFPLAERGKAQYQQGMVVLGTPVSKTLGLPFWRGPLGFCGLRVAALGLAGLNRHNRKLGSKTARVLAGSAAMVAKAAEQTLDPV